VWNVNPKTTPISPEGIFKPGENKYPLAPGYGTPHNDVQYKQVKSSNILMKIFRYTIVHGR
jgi:hypothetical protein